VLQAKGYEVAGYAEYNGAHDYLNWRGSVSDGLISLWGTADRSR
jgi:enterochelin esterase-like enzyme